MEKSLRNNVADDEFAAKFNYNELKNVARCGICQQWFSDHTTMLTHLQTHSDSLACKNFTCCVCKKSFKEQWQLFRHKVRDFQEDYYNGYFYIDYRCISFLIHAVNYTL